MTSEDAELDQLLDSALEDFDNLPKPKVSRKKAGKRHEGGNVLAPSEEDFMKIFESVGGQGKEASCTFPRCVYKAAFVIRVQSDKLG